jgi:hypothetical protein
VGLLAVWTLSALGPGLWGAATQSSLAQQTSGLTPNAGFADPAFQQVWQRTDLPVQQGRAPDRSWMWGPEGRYSGYEPYAEGPSGQRLVEYFDKSRMEINNPNADPKSQWYVTNGLLVVEMMTGQITTGNTRTQAYVPANIPVAGDPVSSLNAPTFASLAPLASLNGNNRAADHTGQPVQTALARNGQQSQVPNLSGYAKYVQYEPTLGHNIPDVFWTFLNQSGIVYQNGQYVNGLVVDWLFAMGYPITEAYWINVQVGSSNVWVLMQAFQRRILTFNPNNDPSFQVEMGNVGLSYYDWRYKGVGAAPATPGPTPPPAPTATPGPGASIALSPESGPPNSTLTVTGSNFPPHAAVLVNVVASSINYNGTVTTVGADGAGNFQTAISLPSEVAQQASVTVAAYANGNAVQASKDFTITHNPTLDVSPYQVTNVGVARLVGNDFPANTDVTVSAYLKNSNGTDTLANSGKVKTTSKGTFDVSYQLTGKAAVGQQFSIVATAPNIKVNAKSYVQIIGSPTVQVVPASGPVGVPIVFQGSNWAPNRLLYLTLQGPDGQTQSLSGTAVTNASGAFSIQVVVPTAYSTQPYVMLWATDSATSLTVQAKYTIVQPPPGPPTATPTATPKAAQPIATPPAPSIGGLPMNVRLDTTGTSGPTNVSLRGTGWPPGTQIEGRVVATNGSINTPVGSVVTKSDGSFQMDFSQNSAWTQRNDIVVTVSSVNGLSTSTQYLPSSTNVKSGGNAFNVTGWNWPRNTKLNGYVFDTTGATEQLSSVTTAPDGSFTALFTVPSTYKGTVDYLSIRTDSLTYDARYNKP